MTILYVNVFRPVEPARCQVVMSADVYGKDSLGQETHERFATHGSVKTSLFTPFESPDPGYWVPHGYVIVKVALRGSSNSGGDLHPMSSTEAKDYCELIEWASIQPWSNGNVGLREPRFAPAGSSDSALVCQARNPPAVTLAVGGRPFPRQSTSLRK